MEANGWIKQTEHWYLRGRESVIRGAGCWMYYSNPIVSGVMHMTMEAAMATPRVRG